MSDLPPPRHLLFDFFGTLVDYADRAEHSEPVRTQRLLNEWAAPLGIEIDEAHLPVLIDRAYDPLEAAAESSLVEYHTFDAMAALLAQLAIPSTQHRVEALARAWIEDWRKTVSAPAGLDRVLADLAAPKSIVSNTSTPWLVPECAAEAGMLPHFEHVVLSVSEGVRKPHPSIYERALGLAGVPPEHALFIGDNAGPDYHGPRQAGIAAVLISARPVAGVPEADRIDTILGLPAWLARQYDVAVR